MVGAAELAPRRPPSLTGTFFAEQRPGGTYDLVSTNVYAGRDGVYKRPARSHGSRSARKVESKVKDCIVLPALDNLETILEREETPPGTAEGLSLPEPAKLPPLPLSARHTARGDGRLSPGRGLLGNREAGSTVPSDEEFMQWLRPMALTQGSDPWHNLEAQTPRTHRPPRVPQRSGGLSSTNPSHTSSTSSFWSAEFLASCQWSLLLLRTTYKVKGMKPEFVARILMEELGMNEEVAMRKATRAASRLYEFLHAHHSQASALAQVELLQRRGVRVSITSSWGGPKSSTPREPADEAARFLPAVASTRNTDFHNVFRSSLHGTDWQTLRPKQLREVSAKDFDTQRSDFDTPIVIIPEDPVETLLEQMGEDDDGESTEKVNRNPRCRLQVLLRRHERKISAAGNLQKRLPGKGRHPFRPSQTTPDESSKDADLWNNVLEAVMPRQKISNARREACSLMRYFAFACIGNEGAQNKRERDKVFYEAMGTQDMVATLYGIWRRLDRDRSGRVDLAEFRSFAETHMEEVLWQKGDGVVDTSMLAAELNASNDKLSGAEDSVEKTTRFVRRLCDKLTQLLLGRKSSFTIEDMMRLIWPCATVADLQVMRSWCKEFSSSRRMERVRTPPLLASEDFAGLCSVFKHFDSDNSGQISLQEMVTKGLIYEEQRAAYAKFFEHFDLDGDMQLDLLEFCDMMCPAGFRAHERSAVASLPSGTRIILDSKLDIWRPDKRELDAVGDASPSDPSDQAAVAAALN